MGPFDHDDLVERSLLEPGQHLGEEQDLLRAAVARCLAGGEDDRADAHQLSRTVTVRMTTGWVGCSVAGSPSRPIASTTS